MTGPHLDSAALERLEALAKAATPGPWHPADRGIGYEIHHGSNAKACCWHRDAECRPVNDGDKDCFSQGDAAYIAAANPAVVLGLIKRIRELEATIEDFRYNTEL